MAHAEGSVSIKRPIHEVFDFLADGKNNARWRPAVIDIKPVGDTVGVGATYAQTLKGPGGRSIAGDYEVTAFDPPSHLAFRVTAGPARPEGDYLLTEDAPGATTVHFSLDLKTAGLMRLMGPMIKRTMVSEVAYLENLKQELETGR